MGNAPGKHRRPSQPPPPPAPPPSPLTARDVTTSVDVVRNRAILVQGAISLLAANQAAALLQIEANRKVSLACIPNPAGGESAASSAAASEIEVSFGGFIESLNAAASAKRAELETLANSVDSVLEELESIATAFLHVLPADGGKAGADSVERDLQDRCTAALAAVTAIESRSVESLAFLAVSLPYAHAEALEALKSAAAAEYTDVHRVLTAVVQRTLGVLSTRPSHTHSASCNHSRTDKGDVWLAASSGDIGALAVAISRGGSTEEIGKLRYDEDVTPIMVASSKGHLDAVRILVDAGADVTAGDEPALSRAAENGHRDIVEYLLTVPGVDPACVESPMGYSALSRAVQFVVCRAHETGTPDVPADVVAALIADPRVDPNTKEYDNSGFTALHRAVNAGLTNLIKLLLACPRVDPNALDCEICSCRDCEKTHGQMVTPLAVAKRSGKVEVIALLLQDPRVRDVPAAHAVVEPDYSGYHRGRMMCHIPEDFGPG